jgi:hypothetical protein
LLEYSLASGQPNRRQTVASINMGVIGVGFIEMYAAVAVGAIPQSAREQRWVAIEY